MTGRTAIMRGAERAWRGFALGWRGARAGARRRWLATLGLGLLGCLVLSTALTIAATRAAAGGALGWEREWLLQLEHGPMSFHAALWLEGLGSSAMLMPLIVAATVLAALAGRSTRAALMIASYVPAKILIFTGWLIWSRARPDFIAGGVAVPPSLHSFPSGHTLQTITVYGLLAWFWARASRSRVEQVVVWALLAVLCGAVALARLRLGTHWPSDVVAGAVIGAAWLGVLIAAERRFENS